jgi:hypothetical protein
MRLLDEENRSSKALSLNLFLNQKDLLALAGVFQKVSFQSVLRQMG